jgi:hypothetical protein
MEKYPRQLESNSIRSLELKSHYYFCAKDRLKEVQVLNEIINREPFDPSAFLRRGLAKRSIDEDGCPDFRKAGELGALEAFSLIKQYCMIDSIKQRYTSKKLPLRFFRLIIG